MAKRKGKKTKVDPKVEAFQAGARLLREHPLFAAMAHSLWLHEDRGGELGKDGWALVERSGRCTVNWKRQGSPQQWAWVLAHCLVNLAFGHLDLETPHREEWAAAADSVAARFLAELKLGSAPAGRAPELPTRDVHKLYERFLAEGVPASCRGWGTGPNGRTGIRPGDGGAYAPDFARAFAEGLARSVVDAVRVAAGAPPPREQGPGKRARGWFLSSYPLLGGLAAGFEIVEDVEVCQRLGIDIAAVDVEAREIYMNPLANLGEEQARFVLAHELLHAGLRHAARRQGRDPWLWNVACDFVINAWLIQMRIGIPPGHGVLHDPELAAESAESLYDRIVRDLRKYRKLATLAGREARDMLGGEGESFWDSGRGMDLDAFYRSALSQGLLLHQEQSRGLLPSGLVEEIRALEQPPIPWDVELARWFDRHFMPLEKSRTFARPSRRQSSTPDIPRARWVVKQDQLDGRTFGVVLDTSGSMDRKLLGKALGAIASYAMSRDVPAVRVVFCDAAAYDEGYMRPEEIAERVRVRGRGGTILQPGVDLLERAKDFPPDGPLLIITDGECDVLKVKRSHAFLLPRGKALPFKPVGEIFRIR